MTCSILTLQCHIQSLKIFYVNAPWRELLSVSFTAAFPAPVTGLGAKLTSLLNEDSILFLVSVQFYSSQ